ncbi:MAG: CDP-alcohol phosphatidyltransferase family protein [Candidatus Aminicenantes bacterium]|nr:CDP-alcohol phosphatidyltransferase family protein [Candidatus Aminicenantes bacterium]
MSLVAEYRRSLKAVEVEEPVDLVLYRPLGFLVVKAVYKTPVTPNQITVFAVFIGLLAGLCYGSGRRSGAVAGALLLAFSIVLDCADGQLARLKKNGTRFGRILDGLVDYIVDISVCVGLGIGMAPENNLWRWVLLLLALAATYVVHSAVLDYYRARFIDAVQGTTTHLEDEDYRSVEEELAKLRAAGGRPGRKLFLGLYLRYCEMQKRLTVRKNDASGLAKQDPEAFRRRNRAAMRGWSFLGGSTANTLFVVATLAGRIDLFFWGVIVLGNIWAVGMYAYQASVDRRIAREAVS